MKVALTVIAAAGSDKEAVQLATMLSSANGQVDRIFLQLNAPKGTEINKKMRAVAEQFADETFEYVWEGNFTKARNDLMSKVPKEFDWIIWADADDIIDCPENIRPTLAIMPVDVHGVYINYDYQKDEFGNVIVSHWVTRAVRNDGSFKWKSSFEDSETSVHETLIATRQVKSVANNEWKIVHNATPEHFKESLERNIGILEDMARRQAQSDKGIDPRIMFYLGTHYNEAYRFNEAFDVLIEYLKVSGWSEERAEAHLFIGRILKNKGKSIQARNAFLQALGENPKSIGAYLELGKLESKEERWEQAAEWLKRGVEQDRPITPMVKYDNDFELYTEYAQALSNLGGKNLSEALRMAQEAFKLRPYDEQAKDNRDVIQKLVNYRDNLRSFNTLFKTLREEDKPIIPFLDTLPDMIQDSSPVISARQQYTEGKTWTENSIAIYVGYGALGIWGPWSLDEGGIGGSEEAVIRLSKELTAMGWAVTVFGVPGKRAGLIDGVEWKQYWEISNKDSFNILISWRQPGLFDNKWDAKKTYLWLHDVMDAEELVPERLENITKIIYVSKYHSERPENEHIANKQKLPSGNGIDPSTFTKYDGTLERDPHRVIYMSANERGLRILIDIWKDVLEAVPGAILTPYYGWQSFDAVNRDNPERMAWKATLLARMRELGIPASTRLGHDDLNKEMFKSGVWAYPCFFPEVNCITAQKAMASGAWPVTSNFAALRDVVKYGDVIDMDDFTEEDIETYKQALILRLQNPPTETERTEMMEWARKTYDWKNTAQQWHKEFKKG